MLEIEKVDHVGIRVSDKQVSIDFYRQLGFELITDVGFDKGHPVIMRHPSGDVLNLLGPADPDRNVIELDGYAGEEPDTRTESGSYDDHL